MTVRSIAFVLLLNVLPYADAARPHRKEKTAFGAEDDARGTVPLPESIRHLLEKDDFVRETMDDELAPGSSMPTEWVQCSLVHLGQAGERDYIVMAKPPLMGANVTSFWVYRVVGGSPVLVMNAFELGVEIMPGRHLGLRDLRLDAATAAEGDEIILRFNGTQYETLRKRSFPL